MLCHIKAQHHEPFAIFDICKLCIHRFVWYRVAAFFWHILVFAQKKKTKNKKINNNKWFKKNSKSNLPNQDWTGLKQNCVTVCVFEIYNTNTNMYIRDVTHSHAHAIYMCVCVFSLYSLFYLWYRCTKIDKFILESRLYTCIGIYVYTNNAVVKK